MPYLTRQSSSNQQPGAVTAESKADQNKKPQ